MDVGSEADTELADNASSTRNERIPQRFRSTSVCFRFLSYNSGSIELTAAGNFASAGEPRGRDRNRDSHPL